MAMRKIAFILVVGLVCMTGVLPETGRAMEHMASFDYGYKIAAVRDWLFKQSKE